MSNTFDQAGTLNAAPLPVESASRQFVFLPAAVSWLGMDVVPKPEMEMLAAWLKWGGLSEFIGEPERAAECGICIFRRGSLGDNNELAQMVKSFFVWHGSEANIFEFDPFSKDFWRVNPHWLETYYQPKHVSSEI